MRVGLLPLDRMGHTAGAIAGGDLSHRVESTDPRTEVGRLGVALNAMLDRLERAFGEREASEDRLRRFIADASHELRTPLASIRGYAELFRMGAAREPADVEKAMRRIEDEAARMGVLVEDLLTLARLDEVPDTPHAELDLAALVRDAVDDGRAAAPGREIDLQVDGAAEVVGDRDQLRQVLGNLLRNAFVHTPEGTPIEVTLAARRRRRAPRGPRPRPGPADQRRRGAVRALLALGGRARARPRRRRPRAGDRGRDRRRARRRGARRQRPGRRRQLRRHAARRPHLRSDSQAALSRLPSWSHVARRRCGHDRADALPAPGAQAPGGSHPHGAPSVEIVVPVFNEEAALEAQHPPAAPLPGRRASRSPGGSSSPTTRAPTPRRPSRWRSRTSCPGVELLRIDRKGRGRALREAWSRSDARVLCYMDVDLSTDLRALLPLVAPLLSGHSDLAIGTRLARSARVVRGPKRELISRAYNRLLHTVLRARFSDAQCGFKAVTATAAGRLLDDVRDDSWFFDTELLVLAQRRGLRIHEVPVDWVDDPDSRVDIVRTAIEDLRGVARLARRRSGGPLHGRRRAEHDRLRRALPRCCTARSAPPARTPSRWPSPRWPTPPPTAA